MLSMLFYARFSVSVGKDERYRIFLQIAPTDSVFWV